MLQFVCKSNAGNNLVVYQCGTKYNTSQMCNVTVVKEKAAVPCAVITANTYLM